MELVMNNDSFNLDSFLDFLYDGLEGYVYLAAKSNTDEDDWKQEFFNYPTDRHKLTATIKGASKSHEVYIAPALYSEKRPIRDNFKISNVVWTEFDGNAPADWHDSNGEPSLIVQSSGDSNQHVYWRLTEPITNVDVLEDINRRLTYNMQADSSAWDATQVLRPPETFNHKRNKPVQVRVFNDVLYDINVFDALAPAPDQITADWEITAMPSVQEVLLKYAFGPDLVKLLGRDKEEVTDRSASLMQLAYGCCELGMNNAEVMAVLLLADDRWEKFKSRKDRHKRLAHIITVARNKYPAQLESDEPFTFVFGFESFLATDIEINWVIEPMLMEQGYMLLAGPSGIGKTQITMQFLIHLALGKDFLHYKIPVAKKILFLSLEMGHGELKKFAESMARGLTTEEITALETNFVVVPHGEPWFMNSPEGQAYLTDLIEQYEPDGVAIDSIGSAIQGNISSDESVQPFLNFNDKIRNKYGVFTWYIHHMRKAKEGGGIDQDDVYGNQYLVNRSTSSYGVLRGKGGSIKMRSLKIRMAEREPDYYLVRDQNLMFHKSTEDVDNFIKAQLPVGPDGMISTTTGGGGFTL